LNGTQCIDLIALASTLKQIRAFLLEVFNEEQTYDARVVGLANFKRLLDSRKPSYKGILGPMEDSILLFFIDPSAKTFFPLFQWYSFIERLNLKSLDKTEEYCCQYKEFENSLRGQTYGTEEIEELQVIMDEFFHDYSDDFFFPSFGPGGVSEVTGSRIGSKMKSIQGSKDSLLDYFSKRLSNDTLPPDIFQKSSCSLTRTNTIVFVPKSVEKNRIISKEPVALGWYQHGIADCLDRMIKQSSFLKGRVDLHDQAKSQDAAWAGSLFGEYATIDLSNASDSITFTLIKKVVRHTKLRRALWCTRSQYAKLPNGETIPLSKFAPMGSAVCFPMETLIFAGMCEMAIRRITGNTSRMNDYTVYGDDIVIKTIYANELMRILASFHFEVNKTKSFYHVGPVNFREACGEYFVNGTSVRPLRLSRRLFLIEQPDSGQRVGIRASLVSLANESFKFGYFCLRGCVLTEISKYYPGFQDVPFTDDPDWGSPDRIITWEGGCTNYNLLSKPDIGPNRPFYGSRAYRILSVYTRPDKVAVQKYGLDHFDDYSDLYLWWRRRLHDDFLHPAGDEYAPILSIDEIDVYPAISDPLRTDEERRWAYLG